MVPDEMPVRFSVEFALTVPLSTTPFPDKLMLLPEIVAVPVLRRPRALIVMLFGKVLIVEVPALKLPPVSISSEYGSVRVPVVVVPPVSLVFPITRVPALMLPRLAEVMTNPDEPSMLIGVVGTLGSRIAVPAFSVVLKVNPVAASCSA